MTHILTSQRSWIGPIALVTVVLLLAATGNAQAQSSGSSGSGSGAGDQSAASAAGDAPGGGVPASGSVPGAVTANVAEIGGLMGDPGQRIIIIDVRPRAAFAKGHLRNAVNLQVRYSDVLRDHVFDNAALGGDKSAKIVVYGAYANDPAAAAVVRKALSEGYSNVIWMRGGFAEWVGRPDLQTRPGSQHDLRDGAP
jgi:rhodanese-related sulfurtransferase